MAERERFELSRALRPYRFSRPALSTGLSHLSDGFLPHLKMNGGERIRTSEDLAALPVFKTGAFSQAQPLLHHNRSPKEVLDQRRVDGLGMLQAAAQRVHKREVLDDQRQAG